MKTQSKWGECELLKELAYILSYTQRTVKELRQSRKDQARRVMRNEDNSLWFSGGERKGRKDEIIKRHEHFHHTYLLY